MSTLSFIGMLDNGGRRLKVERRKKSVPLNFPDRRSGMDRRTGTDRRSEKTDKIEKEKERRKVSVSSPTEL